MVILTNMNGSNLPTALMLRLFDAHLKRRPKDWSAEIARPYAGAEGPRPRPRRRPPSARRDTKPSLPLASYAGTYADSLHGEVVVREQNGKLALRSAPLDRARSSTGTSTPSARTGRSGTGGRASSRSA